MKRTISLLLTLGLLLSLFSGLGLTATAGEPDAVTYEYLQLVGVQGWTQADLDKTSANNGHESNVTATYYLSDQHLVGAATQSIKAVKSSASASFNCLVNKAYGSNAIAAPSPWTPADGVSKVSEYDGVMIAVRDQDGNVPTINSTQLRILTNPASNGWGTYQVSTTYTVTDDGYMKFAFDDFPKPTEARASVDAAQGISFLLYCSGITEYYFSDFKAYRAVKGVDFSALEQAIEELTAINTDGSYTEILNKARYILGHDEATQEVVDQQTKELRQILRPLQLPEVDFDEDNIVVSFGAVSDIHITGSTTSSATKKYESALQQLKAQAGGKLDAITVAGDISESSYSSSITTAFKTITNQELGENANVFFISGNHDAQSSEWSKLSSFYSDLAIYTKDDLASSQLDRGNRHKVINGYHYIGVNMMDYWNAKEARFETQDLEWLGRELAAARAAAPGQPIFVYVHAGVYGTTYGSDLYTGSYWGSKAIYSYLEDYPEVVTFSGHVHYPLMDERTIWQEDFTSLNCGSVQYMAIDNGYLQTGSSTTVSGSHSISSGLLVQVDKNNNLKITRINFAAGEVIKEPFYISAPDLENGTNLLHYNEDYFNLYNTAPTFPIGAMATGSISGTNINVNFDAATDDDMVHHYLLEIKDKASGQVYSTKIYSEFYFYSNPEEMPTNYSFKVPYSGATGDKAFDLTLYAVDSMGLRSEPITFDSTAPAKNGWVYEYGKWGFYVDSIRMTEMWLPEGEKWYYVDRTGYRVTGEGLFFDGSDWFYIAEDGAQQYNVWYRDGDTVHYFGGDGYMVTGQWITYEGADYYFDKDGLLVTAQWLQDRKGWCYVDETGARVTNAWVERDGVSYYVREDGYMATNLWVTLDGAIYYLDGDGQKICNSWIADG
ncbi:MAG: metallophosphoesterase, partial [Clostridia bacterium]|nr:metallophosphoesterase [Clostridia bacterium]